MIDAENYTHKRKASYGIEHTACGLFPQKNKRWIMVRFWKDVDCKDCLNAKPLPKFKFNLPIG